ncbi:hypothetical protein V1509DRAFT_613959 [Lipomyces kononenkoae]
MSVLCGKRRGSTSRSSIQGQAERDYGRLSRETLSRYAQHVETKCGCPTIWGFIDGTFRPTTCPIEDQRLVYSGYKCAHGFKYQAVVALDGLVTHLFGLPAADPSLWWAGVQGLRKGVALSSLLKKMITL